ncbi:MAG: hypothetical protein IJ787_00885 [Bacilli bacterium]|nr:hypothetical protein [Bacilli bacterium]
MSGPKYYNYDIGDSRLAKEIVAQMRAISGVQIRVEGGRICTVVSNDAWYGGIHYDTLQNIIAQTRQAIEDGEQFKAEKVKRIKDENERIKKVTASFEQNLAAIEAVRGQVQAKLRTIAPERGKYISVDMTKELSSEIQNSLAALNEEAKNQQQQLKKAQSDSQKYIAALNAAQFSSDLRGTEHLTLSTAGKVSPEKQLKILEQNINARQSRIRAFVKEADALVDKVAEMGIGEYQQDVLNLIRNADPMCEKPFREVEAFIQRKLEERRAALATAESYATMDKAKENVAAQLAELAKISARINASMAAAHLVKEDNSSMQENLALAKEVFDMQAAIFSSDYLTRKSREEASRYAADLQNASMHLAQAQTSNELKKILSRTKALAEKVAEEAQSHAKFEAAQEKYEKARDLLVGEATGISDYFFDPTRYEDQIKEMEEKTAQIEYAIAQRQALATSQALMSQIGEDRIVDKKMAEDGVSFLYTHPDNPGVIFDAKAKYGEPLAIYPRGVILSNGMKATTEEQLRKTHSSCGWSSEMTDSLHSIGLPEIHAEEMGDEVTESMYDEAEFYRCQTEEESIALLRKWGVSDADIESIYHYVLRKEENTANRGSFKTERREQKLYKTIDPRK